MKYCIFFFFSFCFCLSLCAQKELDSLLTALDHTIGISSEYERNKVLRINMIKEALKNPKLSREEVYWTNAQLFQEYKSYICDSARYYINKNIELAILLNKEVWFNESKLKKVQILATSGLYAEAMKLLNTVDKTTLSPQNLVDYYMAFENIYLYQAEYVSENEYMHGYLDKMNLYRDSILIFAPENSYQYIITKAPVLVDQHKLKEAEEMLLVYLPQADPNTRDYAVLTSILAFVYECDGQEEPRKIYLIKSAIADIKAQVKENNSLRVLAEILYKEGQFNRANHYVKASIEDANFFNARLRNLQASKMLPIIDKAYQLEKEAQRKHLQILLLIISILSVFLMIAIIYVVLQMKKLAYTRSKVIAANQELQKLNTDLQEANKQKQLTNNSLQEANCIKEEYIGRFLGLCSAYIDKLETYRRMLNKKATTGKTEELFKTLKSSQFIDDELKEFYHNFDNAFLNIYPNFVECFNKLLPEEEKIVPKQDERLTTELRIFALIRLGITDSAKIASFLRYSITTIYTYRSKLRNKSLSRDNFEELVMKIGSFQT